MSKQLQLYRRYLAGKVGAQKVLDAVVEDVGRIVTTAASKRKIKTWSLQFEEVFQRVLLRVWRAIKKKLLPSDLAPFRSYLSKIIRREVISYLTEEETNRKEEFPPEVMQHVVSRSINWAEDSVFFDEYATHLRKKVLDRFQKQPSPNLGAVKFVLDRYLNGDYISFHWLTHHYRVTEPDFFVDRVKIALRQEVWEFSESHYESSSSLIRNTLYGSYDSKANLRS